MDPRLFEATRTGNVEAFQQLLQENPMILGEIALTSTENPLHIACKVGHLDFVRMMKKQMPEFARELDQNGFRPMDIASANGHLHLVREHLTIGHDLCHLKGRDNRTPIHYAAIKGRIEVLNELLSTCPESAEDVTARGETVLHLAIKNSQFEAVRVLVSWLERLNKEDLVKKSDQEGNTVLHLATSRKQAESVKLLLSSSNAINRAVEVNATNARGLTAMDVLDVLNDVEEDLRDILQRAGGFRTHNIAPIHPAPSPHQEVPTNNQTTQRLPSETFSEWLQYFQYQKKRDSPSDARNTLLVIATLMATATFQAGITPPGGLWQENSTTHKAGHAILASDRTLFTIFLFVNSLVFSMSMTIIGYLMMGFPFQRELQLALLSMMYVYGYSVGHIVPETEYSLPAILVSFFIPFLARELPKLWKRWIKPSSSIDEARPGV